MEQIQNLLDASVTSWHREYSNLFLHFDTPTSIRLPGSSAQVLTPIRVDEAGALIARDESGAETTFTVADVDLPIPLHPTDSLASPAVHAPRKGANA